MRTHHLIAAAVCVMSGLIALAQEPSSTLVMDAPIFLLPTTSGSPLRWLRGGTVVEIIDGKAQWLQVRFRDPRFGLRIAFVESRFVRPSGASLVPMDLSVAGAKPQNSPPSPARLAPRRPSRSSLEPVDRAVVLADAPVMLLPDTNRTPIRMAAAGSVLIALQEDEEWVRVRFQDPQSGRREGYVQRRFLRIQRASLAPVTIR